MNIKIYEVLTDSSPDSMSFPILPDGLLGRKVMFFLKDPEMVLGGIVTSLFMGEADINIYTTLTHFPGEDVSHLTWNKEDGWRLCVKMGGGALRPLEIKEIQFYQ